MENFCVFMIVMILFSFLLPTLEHLGAITETLKLWNRKHILALEHVGTLHPLYPSPRKRQTETVRIWSPGSMELWALKSWNRGLHLRTASNIVEFAGQAYHSWFGALRIKHSEYPQPFVWFCHYGFSSFSCQDLIFIKEKISSKKFLLFLSKTKTAKLISEKVEVGNCKTKRKKSPVKFLAFHCKIANIADHPNRWEQLLQTWDPVVGAVHKSEAVYKLEDCAKAKSFRRPKYTWSTKPSSKRNRFYLVFVEDLFASKWLSSKWLFQGSLQ